MPFCIAGIFNLVISAYELTSLGLIGCWNVETYSQALKNTGLSNFRPCDFGLLTNVVVKNLPSRS
ncbi:MAG: hypothetical protein NZT61_04205 [Deltaproteobacteria bacterium]|nr:hypothetical protein [Deltaproteobacteria bacterium]